MEGNKGISVRNMVKKRMSKEEIRMGIVNIYSEWVSLEYIATTIDRNSGYLLDYTIPLC